MRMLGVAEDDRERIVHHADAAVSWNDPEYLAGREPLAVIGEAMAVLHGAAFELASARASSPKEDLLSALVHARRTGSD
jgi:cytochrome P450